MHETRFSALSRQANLLLSRRATAQAITGGGLAALLSLLSDAEAKKKRKRRKKKGKKKCKRKNVETPPPVETPLTCAEQCPGRILCANRPTGELLCADNIGRDDCVPCSTDQDCIGAVEKDPYCSTSLTHTFDNQTFLYSGCGDYAVGLCTSILIVG